VFNDSSDVVTFKDPKCRSEESEESVGYYEEASSTNCHFHLRFEKDLGLTNEIQIEQSSDSDQWLFRCDEEEHFFSIYFLHKQELKLSQHDDITICFLNLTANNRTVKTSNVEVLYGEKALVWKGRDPKHIGDEISSRIAISVINHPRKTKIPLQFRVLGSNKILNDGTTKNTLILKVINSPLSNNEREILLLDQSSKFIVSFEQGDHPDALVARTGQLNAVQIAVGDTNSWASEHTANTPQWSFTPKINQLTADQGIELTISNLVTNSASGFACIYIDYQNIGSYPDGRLVIPIEKTPLLYSGQNVGIRNNDPRIHLAIGDNDTGLQQQGDNELAIYTDNAERVRFDKKGNVGIGTNSPAAKLHVNDGDALISGKVGIGITNPTAKLHVNGGDALISGKVGIGITNPTAKLHVDGISVVTGKLAIGNNFSPEIDLAIGDNQTGLKLDYYKSLSLMAKGQERVRIVADGPVVINGGLIAGSSSTSIDRILCGKVIVRPGVSPSGWACYGAEIRNTQRTQTGAFTLWFNTPFMRDGKFFSDDLILMLTSGDATCTVHLVQLAEKYIEVQTRDATTQKPKDASFHLVIIKPTSHQQRL
jgi:hypothetical protein